MTTTNQQQAVQGKQPEKISPEELQAMIAQYQAGEVIASRLPFTFPRALSSLRWSRNANCAGVKSESRTLGELEPGTAGCRGDRWPRSVPVLPLHHSISLPSPRGKPCGPGIDQR